MEVLHFDLSKRGKGVTYSVFVHENSQTVPMHDHTYYEVFLTETEGITHEVNGEKFVLPAGTLCFVRMADVHSMWYAKEEVFRHINFSFSEQIFERLMLFLENDALRHMLLASRQPPMVVLDSKDRRTLDNKIRRISLLKEINKNESDMYMRHTLMDIFMTHFCNIPKEDKGDMPGWLQYTVRQMQNPVNFEMGVRRMVEISERSINYLEKTMKKYMGQSPREYINRLRIQYAASMLKNSDMNILDIALDCGFKSSAYFYKLFNEQFGASPREYRKRYR